MVRHFYTSIPEEIFSWYGFTTFRTKIIFGVRFYKSYKKNLKKRRFVLKKKNDIQKMNRVGALLFNVPTPESMLLRTKMFAVKTSLHVNTHNVAKFDLSGLSLTHFFVSFCP